MLFALGLFLGWVILSVGLFAARAVPKAIPVSVLICLLLNLLGLELLSRLFFLLGLGWLGVVVVSMRDDAWVARRIRLREAEHLTKRHGEVAACTDIGVQDAPVPGCLLAVDEVAS